MREPGVAVVERVDDRERVEHVDDVQNARDQQRGSQQRQGDPGVGLPGGRTVDAGGLVHVARDRLEPGEQDVGGERQRDEHPDGDHRRHRPPVVAEEVDRRVEDPDRDQEPVDDAVVVVEQEREQPGGDDEGRRPRDDHRPAHHFAAEELLAQQLGQAERDHQGQHQHGDDPHDRVDQHRSQVRVGQHLGVVRKARRPLEQAGDGVVRHRGPHELGGRVEHHRGDEDERRTQPRQGGSHPHLGAAAARRGPVAPGWGRCGVPGRPGPATRCVAHAQPPDSACAWSLSSTAFGSPFGATAAPMFCCTASLTRSQFGSSVGVSLAPVRVSR